jgi:metallo-beta-lactamase class B
MSAPQTGREGGNMKRTLATVLIVAAVFLTQTNIAAAQDDFTPTPPFKIFDNLYYVGIRSVSAFALRTSGGIVLIDATYEESSGEVIKAMQQIGLNPKDIRYIIVTHAHSDHAAGAPAIQALSGARVGMAQGDWDMYAKGGYLSSGGQNRVFPPMKQDLVIKDGDTLTVGDTTLKFYVTPGHTPGVTSMEFPVIDGGRRYKAVMFGGTGLNTVNGVRNTEQYIASVRRMMAVPDLQVNLTNHPQGAQIFQRRDRLAARRAGDAHPFVDPPGFQKYFQDLLAGAERKLAAEKAAGRP